MTCWHWVTSAEKRWIQCGNIIIMHKLYTNILVMRYDAESVILLNISKNM